MNGLCEKSTIKSRRRKVQSCFFMLIVFITHNSVWKEFSPQEGLICLRSDIFWKQTAISPKKSQEFQQSFTSFAFFFFEYTYAYFQRRKFLVWSWSFVHIQCYRQCFCIDQYLAKKLGTIVQTTWHIKLTITRTKQLVKR